MFLDCFLAKILENTQIFLAEILENTQIFLAKILENTQIFSVCKVGCSKFESKSGIKNSVILVHLSC